MTQPAAVAEPTSLLDAPTDQPTGADAAPVDPKPSADAAGTPKPGAQAPSGDAPSPDKPSADEPNNADKPADKPANVVPEKYADPKLPDTVAPLTPEFKTELDSVAKELGLSQESYQKVVDLGTKLMETNTKAAMDLFHQQHQEWASETKKALGANYKAELALAAKAIDRAIPDPAANKAFREMLSEGHSGLGNWLPLVKAFAHFGKAISEDTLVPGRPVAVDQKQKSVAETIFDHPTSIAAAQNG